MRHDDPHVVSIPPGAPYLPTLVDALLNGNLIKGFAPANDPTGYDPVILSSVTIWVPTRRAARALASEFTSRLKGDVALLPQIKALGDGDEDSLFFETAGELHLQPSMGSLERHLILTRLVASWANQLNTAERELYQGAEIVMPSSLCDAVWFAADLAHLMDMVATEEVDWKELENLVPDAYGEWWKLTLEFLKIATLHWPKILSSRGMCDATTGRANMLRAQAKAYRENGADGPVIAAGSTGSIPATADLLNTISRMENGVLVLPGLDRDMDDEAWSKVDLPDNDRDDSGTAPGHPQYGLKKLLAHVGIERNADTIRHIGGIEDKSVGYARLRETLISEALRPSASTGTWQEAFKRISIDQRCEAFAGVTLIEARGEREEALAIALALRETLEDKSKTVALVTPDRNLARRVAVEMRRFGVGVDDSAGQPLRNRPSGTFARLVLQVAFGAPDPITLISLLKHPLALFGAKPERTRRAARLFELAILRGARSSFTAGNFHTLADDARRLCDDARIRTHRSIKRFSDQDWGDLKWLAISLDEIFGAVKPFQDKALPLNQLAVLTVQFIEACGRDEDQKLNRLYGNEEGRVLSGFLGELLDETAELDVNPSDWPDVFDALLGHRVVRPIGGVHPRVSILGPLEARLQTYDRVVLGGLNEKTWPAVSRNDPFLSRPMKSSLGLPPPERRTGLAAHDFQILLGMEDVILTRSLKADNAPTIASRWVQRMVMVAGKDAAGKNLAEKMKLRGANYLVWAQNIDTPLTPAKACSQPNAKSPVEARPERLSITEIEKWISDPYQIYAKHILKLHALEPLQRDADARERGTLYHAIMEEFVKQVPDPTISGALDKLLVIGRQQFNQTNVPPEISAIWWPRFFTIAKAFLQWHKGQFEKVQSIHVELAGNANADLDRFTLTGRVDRVDVMKDGSFSVYDYKTGLNPNISAVKKLEAPQLPLSALLIMEQGVGNIQSAPSDLGYIRLRDIKELKVDMVSGGKDFEKSLELTILAKQNLQALINAYRDPDKQYLSKARIISDKDWVSDYDHLARVREWSFGEDGEGET